jgi:hypothetical protein
MRRASKVDDNQSDIIDALFAHQCSVQSLASVGMGVPDLLVGRDGRLFLLEVKVPGEKLTHHQELWHLHWKGYAHVVHSVDEALAVVMHVPIPPSADDGFEAFWALYPRHVGKAAAQKAWRKLSPSKSLRQTISTDVEARTHMADWIKDNGQYIPHAATYLNGRRWEDEKAVEIYGRRPSGPCPRCGNPAGSCTIMADCTAYYLERERSLR